ncbi:MAG: FAD-dependent oxidoreductase [Pseudomonadales bacterium]|nr:FAD-dependent oxidoreductase [Pseudomonadales bacterium]
MSTPASLRFDIAILGGGVAGLWLLNDLRRRGYSVLLLETHALGGGQSIASQGMIHGGIKYSLAGALSGASEAIAAMPDYWRRCLSGAGDLDLRQARVLSEHFYLWSSNAAGSRVTTFLASRALRGRVDAVPAAERPPLFREPAFQGSLYRLVDLVLDVPSLIAALAAPWPDAIFSLADVPQRWARAATGALQLELDTPDGRLCLAPAAFVCAAGAGNETLLAELGASAPAMQRRPLQQIFVRHRYPHALHGHCLGRETTPRLTVSSHPAGAGEQVWYLGGTLAEEGVGMAPAALIERARRELAELLPWVALGADARWGTLAIDRAEPRQHGLLRPDQAFADWADCPGNALIAWPTKLTLCPNLAAQVAARLAARGIAPRGGATPALPLPPPPLAATPWQEAFDD